MPSEDEVYLTFDDGPVPDVTPFVLDTLARYGAKATFFCVGENVLKYPALYQRILDEGHTVGNHTHNHLNGWHTSTKKYLSNTTLAAKHIQSKLYRPPYGKLRPAQFRSLKKLYDVVMWDVLSMDYSSKVSPKRCADNVIENTSAGSIIVFHDSEKAKVNLEYALPRSMEYFQSRGWKMNKLPNKINLD